MVVNHWALRIGLLSKAVKNLLGRKVLALDPGKRVSFVGPMLFEWLF